jgi:hypothetical protein
MLQGTINKVDGQNSARGLYSFNGKGSGFFQGITTFFLSGLGAAAIPARLRLRKNLGERAFSPFALIISVVFYTYIVYTPLINLIWPNKDESNIFSEILAILLLMFSLQHLVILIATLFFNSFIYLTIKTIRLAYLHFQKVYSKSHNQYYQYSYYRGDPINTSSYKKIGKTFFGYTIDEKLVRIYFEPRDFIVKHLMLGFVSIIIASLLVYSKFYMANIYGEDKMVLTIIVFCTLSLFFYSVSNFILSFSGLCLLLEELAIAKKIRDSVLDIYDGEYDMLFLMKQKEALQNKSTESESLDIAESIFQNSEPFNTASFPSFISEDDTSGFNNVVEEKKNNSAISSLGVSLQNHKKEASPEKKNERKSQKGDSFDLDNFINQMKG